MQLCVVHLVRNSLRFASKKYWGQITKQLKLIYTAPTLEAAEAEFAVFAEAWRDKYPAMVKSWETAWPEFVPFLDFPADLRKIVYTTDVIVNQLPRVFGVASERREPHKPVLPARRGLSRRLVVL